MNLFIQAGFSYNIRNKNDAKDSMVWTWPLGKGMSGTAWMVDDNKCINNYSIKASLGLSREFYGIGQFSLSLNYSYGFLEFYRESVTYKYSFDSKYYSDEFENKGDYFAIGLGYSIPIMKKYFYSLTDKLVEIPLKPKKIRKNQLQGGFVPRFFVEPAGGFSLPFTKMLHSSQELKIKTKAPLGGYYGVYFEYGLSPHISVLSGFIRNLQVIRYRIYNFNNEPIYKSDVGSYSSEIPLAFRYYLPLNEGLKLILQSGINYNLIYDNDYFGGYYTTLPDSLDVKYTRETSSSSFFTASAGIGVLKKINKLGEFFFISSFNLGFKELQHESLDVTYNGITDHAEFNSKHNYLAFSMGYRIPLMKKKFYMKVSP